jgi:Restriction endonuclease
MTEIDRGHVAKLLAEGDQADTMAGRGRALENVIAYIFGLIPGLDLSERNQLSASGAEEIDLGFWNDGHPAGLRGFHNIILVECKNWSVEVGSRELTLFSAELRSRNRPLGVFIAASGITGDAVDLSAAHSVLGNALNDGCPILVLTRAELEALTDTDEIVTLLKRKMLMLAVRRSCLPQHLTSVRRKTKRGES